jgi:N-acetylglucosamine malate deacetylase 2
MSDESKGTAATVQAGSTPRRAERRENLLQVEPVLPVRQPDLGAELWQLPTPERGAGVRLVVPSVTLPALVDVAALPEAPAARWTQPGPAARPTLEFPTTRGPSVSSGNSHVPAGAWVTPSRPTVTLPSVWTPVVPDARYTPARSRVRTLLDRFCATDPSKSAPRTVVVAAHPDDEAIGVGSRLAHLSDSLIVHVTDGAPRDPAYALCRGFRSRDAYAASRRNELMRALTLMGVPAARFRCLGIVDGEATDNLVGLTYRLVALFDEFRPDVAVTHPYEGGHTDHDATAFAVHLACGILRRDGGAAPIIVEMPSYHLRGGVKRVGDFLPHGDLEERTIELDATARALKARVYGCFSSQSDCLASFSTDRERFRAAPRYVFTRAPHAGPLLYERGTTGLSGSRWRQTAGKALEQLRHRRRRFVVS